MLELKDYLSYDTESGKFTWIRPRKGIKKDKTAGRKDRNGYVTICFDGKPYLAHRLAWWFCNGRWPTLKIDHINKDKQDNRILNLREATTSQNSANSSPRLSCSSPFKGVSWHKRDKRWRAKILNRHLGNFLTEELAAEAYNDEAKRLFGEFAELNKL